MPAPGEYCRFGWFESFLTAVRSNKAFSPWQAEASEISECVAAHLRANGSDGKHRGKVDVRPEDGLTERHHAPVIRYRDGISTLMGAGVRVVDSRCMIRVPAPR
jgi:hypothetical protein